MTETTMPTEERDESELGTWAVIELMGHRRIVGRFCEATIAGAPMLRVDVAKRDGSIGATQFYSATAVYCLTPTTKAEAIATMNPRPTLLGAGEDGVEDDDCPF